MANKKQSILRGARYYNRRDRETNEMPKWEQSMPAIMADVKNYLDSIKKPEVKPEKPKEVKVEEV